MRQRGFIHRVGGFTLMELLIVVAILLVLATIGFSNFVFSLKKARDAQRKSDLATIAKGLEIFANDFGAYPDDDGAGRMVACDYSGSGLVSCSSGSPLAAYVGNYPNGAVVTYLAEYPADPSSQQSYYYEKSANGFNLYAALENTNDPSYQSGLTAPCGTGVTCNYRLTESGVN